MSAYAKDMDSEILEKSEAWRRLNTPSPQGSDEYLVRVKHDFVNVFTSFLECMRAFERGFEYDRERITKVETDYDKLIDRLFNDEKGAFVRARGYTDSKFNKLTGIMLVAGTGIITAAVMQLLGFHAG